jgi:hypothetical protein
MAIKYITIFQSKALQNLPKLGFLVWKKPSGNPTHSAKRPTWFRLSNGGRQAMLILSCQGCQIFLATTYQNGKNIPNDHKMYPTPTFGSKIDKMAIKNTNIFYYKTFQNLPKLWFLVWKYTIWHHCLSHHGFGMHKTMYIHRSQGDQFVRIFALRAIY